MILKDVKFGFSEDSLLKLYHPQGDQVFQLNHDLATVTKLLLNPDYRMDEKKLSLFHRFLPQNSNRLATLSSLFDHFKDGREFRMQTKLDGWRVLMHYERGVFKWYSRNDVDYTRVYGADAASGSLAPFVSRQLLPGVDKCVFLLGF